MQKSPTRMMVVFTILGGSAIGGFGIHRLLTGDYALAIFDFFIALCFLSLGYHTYKTGRDTIARFASAVIAVIGPLFFLRTFDTAGIYWIYSSTIVIFYLVPHRWAIAFNVLMLAGVGAVFWNVDYSPIQLYSFLVTIALINGFSLMFALNEERNKRALTELTVRDELTGVGNRRAFSEKMVETINLNKRYGLSACLVYFDIDRFKQINDQFGHATGDRAIKALTQFVTGLLRESDSVFRIGGDEFVIIAEGTDDITARQLTEKIRQSVAEASLIREAPVTLSLGVALLQENDTPDSWLARADALLYKAKQAGRNKVEVAESTALAENVSTS